MELPAMLRKQLVMGTADAPPIVDTSADDAQHSIGEVGLREDVVDEPERLHRLHSPNVPGKPTPDVHSLSLRPEAMLAPIALFEADDVDEHPTTTARLGIGHELRAG